MRVAPRALLVMSTLFLGLPAWSASAGDPEVEARVRRAAGGIYVHGMSDQIARTEVGPEGVPVLLRLLFEPDLPRRDNVVAFLAHLDAEGMTQHLVAFLDGSPGALDNPDEERALLLVPLALARRAARGDAPARAALDRLVQPGLSAAQRPGPSSLAELLHSQARVALSRIGDEAALRGGAGGFVEGGEGAQPPPPGVEGEGEVSAALDTNARRHETSMTIANHVDLQNKVTGTSADQILTRMTQVAATADFAADVACCTRFVRAGPVPNFGTPGDGRDTLDSDEELRAVLNLPLARIKVVRAINHCNGPGTNILGCSYTPGPAMSVVRTASEGVLWLHEYGHNTGLNHVSQSNNVMFQFLVATALGLNQDQCDRYHEPSSLADANPRDVGACSAQSGCTDADQDGYGNPGNALCPGGAATDCNDTNANVNPGRRDLCNNVDNDCDGEVDDDAVCSTFDVNGDGRVAGAELAWIGRAFGACSTNPSAQWWFEADYDADGCVDGDDLSILSVAWNCTGTRSICP